MKKVIATLIAALFATAAFAQSPAPAAAAAPVVKAETNVAKADVKASKEASTVKTSKAKTTHKAKHKVSTAKAKGADAIAKTAVKADAKTAAAAQ